MRRINLADTFAGVAEEALAKQRRMRAMVTSSVEAIVHGIIRGRDLRQLKALSELFGEDMLGEYQALKLVEERKLALVLEELLLEEEWKVGGMETINSGGGGGGRRRRRRWR